MGWRTLGLVVALLGCGRISFDPLLDGSGAPVDAIDAAPLGPFGPAVAQDLGGQAEDPTLTSDLLELYFASARAGGAGGEDLWFAARGSSAAAWGLAAQVPGINTAGHEGTPEISRDGLTLWFASDRAGSTGIDIYVMTRSSRQAAWLPPIRVTELCSAQSDYPGGVDGATLTLVQQTDRAGSVGNDIYLSTRSDPGSPWSAPVAVTEVNSTASEFNPALDRDGTILLVASTRPGGKGSYDVYESTRDSASSAWSTPSPLAEINASADDGDPWLSDDRRVIYFSSTRSGTQLIYEATR